MKPTIQEQMRWAHKSERESRLEERLVVAKLGTQAAASNLGNALGLT
jgi:hypothetical protein